MTLPKKVNIIEVGLRDGLQMEKNIIPFDLKLKLLKKLSESGLKKIQAVSFVNPKIAPQMKDAERLCAELPCKDNITYTGLALNLKGVERAHKAGLMHIDVSISASETHGLKNTGISLKDAVKGIRSMILAAKEYNMKVSAGIQCAFGCVYEGIIPLEIIVFMAKEIISMEPDKLLLADTTGMATPESVKKTLETIKPIAKEMPIILHLHDTRGMGLANVSAGLECGITDFDSSFGGMGGCPFVKGAAGNISTEHTVSLMESMGIETGINIEKIAECTKIMEEFLRR